MNEEIELVATHCKHDDCVYRSTIDYGRTPICFYAALVGVSRNCNISECDKYQSGTKIQPRMTEDYLIWWEHETNGNADSVR